MTRSTSLLPRQSLLAVAAFLLFSMLLSGCGIFSPDEKKEGEDPPPVDSFKPLTSPDNVLNNFRESWEKKNIERYRELLSNAFTFFFHIDDIGELGVPADGWNFDLETEAAFKMFNQETGTAGEPAIVSIRFIGFDPIFPAWRDGGQFGQLFEGTLVQEIRAKLTVIQEGENTVNVDGDQRFFVENEGTETEPAWRLKYWEDLGKSIAKEAPSEELPETEHAEI